MRSRAEAIRELVALAGRLGATKAKAIRAEDIVVDERVRLKCSLPLCDNYDRHLLCPPNVASVEEFGRILARYKSAILLQLEADYDSTDRSRSRLNARIQRQVEAEAKRGEWEGLVHSIVSDVEAAAFKKGFYLAAGLIASECALCAKCVGKGTGKVCRHPSQARPSMQAMGIDVIKTCKKAGMPVVLSSSESVRWTGLVLLD